MQVCIQTPSHVRGKNQRVCTNQGVGGTWWETIILGLSHRVFGYPLPIVDPRRVGVRATTFLTTTPIPLSPKQITRRRDRLPRKFKGKKPVPQAHIAAVFLSMSN